VLQGVDPAREASFTLRNRLARAAWGIVWTLLFRPSPRPLHGWRAALLRAFGARLGPHVHVYPSVRVWAPWNLQIDGYVGIGDRAILYNMGTLRIGHHAVVSQGAHLCGGTHDPDSERFQLVAAPITIGAHAWICADAFLGPGVRVADGAVVGARSVVVRDLEQPWTIYAGHPARARRPRRRTGELGAPCAAVAADSAAPPPAVHAAARERGGGA
jgi:putative colanic acid biosynthesis acetyltransferase WcaF